MIDQLILPGTEKFFEYHCWEDPQSGDAELWYRSHCKVKVLALANEEEFHHEVNEKQRFEECMQLVYKVQFPDGHQGDVWEDELLNSPEEYERPDPPKKLS